MVDYSPLWKTMQDKGVTKYALINKYKFDAHTLQSLRNNDGITLHTLEMLCKILDCTPNDVVRFID